MKTKGLHFKRVKCKNCGLEQNIALSDIPEFRSFEKMECRQCQSVDKEEIPMIEIGNVFLEEPEKSPIKLL